MLKSILLPLILILSLGSKQTVYSADVPQPAASKEEGVETAPVKVDGAVLFIIRGVTAYPASERAEAIALRVMALADDPVVKTESVAAVESGTSTDIMAGDRIIMSVFDADAGLEKIHRQALAKIYVAKIRTTIETYRRERGSRNILLGAASTLAATLGLIALLLLIRRCFRLLYILLEERFTARIRELQTKSHDIVQTGWILVAIRGGLRTARIILVLVIVLFYVNLVLSLFPWTRTYAAPLFDLLLTPLRSMGRSTLEYLPKLVFLVILVLVTRYGLNALREFFLGIERGSIRITGFDADWAIPAYKVARLIAIAFAVVVAYPYIPGSESPAFKGVSLFLGIVFSLGSSSSIANITAGYMVIFRRAFKVGDRVKIGEYVGDVVEIRLQTTHLRTIKNEEISVPNSLIINTQVVNYSSFARKGSLILHTAVTIGYDAPWRQVHAMLLMAAKRTEGLLSEPEPFVLQTSLDDFYVTYELNAYTNNPQQMAQIYSDLHQSIQDAFNEFGVQIMSPHYENDPSQVKIVPKQRWHQSPAVQDDHAGQEGPSQLRSGWTK